MLWLPLFIVTVFSELSQLTLALNASTINLRGTRVLPVLGSINGAASSFIVLPFNIAVLSPILRVICTVSIFLYSIATAFTV